jgi:peptidyl-prolyl cis-trans isomerase D
MLEVMRRNSRSAIIYVMFGVIIAVFVLSFGPGGSHGCSPGAGAATYAVRVGNNSLSEQDFRFAYLAVTQGQTRAPQLRELVMHGLIDRELLAQQAEKLGIDVSQKEVEDMIAEGRMIVIGYPRNVEGLVFKNGKFDYEKLKAMSQNQLGVSVLHFIEIERRELLAEKMRELLRLSAKVSPDEVKSQFVTDQLQVNLEYARFSQRRFEDDSEATPAEIDAYVKAHADELKKAYEDRAFLYKKVDKQVRARHVRVDVAKDAAPAEVAAAQKQIEGAQVRLKSGTAFADVAKSLSSDEHDKKRGGLIGWRKKGFTGFGAALDDKVFAAKKGDVVGPVRTERGFELVLVEDFREGDVPLEVAEREMAEEKVHEERAHNAAKAEADKVMERLKKGEKLESILPKDTGEDKGEKSPLAKLVEAPKLQETGLFSRHGDMIQDIGVSKELAKKAFELKQGEIGGPYETAGGWVIVRVKEHKDPDLTDFEKRKVELMRKQERTKYGQVLDSWSKQHCVEVRDEGHIKVNDDVLASDGPTPVRQLSQATGEKFTPCSPSRMF